MTDTKEDQLLWFTNLLIKSPQGVVVLRPLLRLLIIDNKIKQNIQLAEELHKPIIRKFEKRKVYSRFRDNIWGADLADIQLISKFNKGYRFLLCVIDIFSKYALGYSIKR